MPLTVPELCLVVLIGPSGSGKSTFARQHFKATEILSSDVCRGLVSDDENDQAATGDAFDVLHYVAAKRLTRGLLTVIDATNVQPESRRPLVQLARDHDVLPVAIVLNQPEQVCHERNRARADRQFGPHVVRQQAQQLRRGLRGLEREGFRHVHVLHTPEDVAQATFERQPLWNNRKSDHGPFDIVGDIHGCYDELIELLRRLGYDVADVDRVVPPTGRKAIFLGDLCDRGPKSPQVVRLVMAMVAAGVALCVPGNHDAKLLRKLSGKNVQLTHGLDLTMEQFAQQNVTDFEPVRRFLDALVSHYVLDGGRLVVAHAGMKQQYIGRASGRVREFALYGDTTGESDEFGMPVRLNWGADYRGDAAVVYGHTPVAEADWLNNTINIDTGCVFGGKLTALRWPERELVSVPCRQLYCEPSRPFLPDPTAAALSAQQQHDDVLDLADVLGKRIVTTRLLTTVTVREENSAAALEVMSRFAVDPKWLVYLPPTMAPTETTSEPGLLEHPREAFSHFEKQGVGRVICEEKHMGSRAVVVVCRDAAAARARFGVADGGSGVIVTRTGRRFFEDHAVETELLDYVRRALDRAGLWAELSTDWAVLDCELMPWSAKAQDLLKNQYAAVGSAATAALHETTAALQSAAARYAALGHPIDALLDRQQQREAMATQYVDAYRRYCWPVHSVADLKLAPFHLLASEGQVHVDKDHVWHMTTLARLAEPGTPLVATAYRVIDVVDAASVSDAVDWWTALTAGGGEGMVVKPLAFTARGPKGLVQPAIKCRGREYLRIIYGPEYTTDVNLQRLRKRGLAAKRSLALREFALGVEGLERFVRREPLRRVHECVFGVMALESEPVDPRL